MASKESSKVLDSMPLCANGCGFYASPTTFNLCSKCYGDHSLQQQLQRLPRIRTFVRTVVDDDSSSPSSQHRMKSMCDFYEKRVKMMGGFKCRCGGTFCLDHRHPETHVCFFDFKARGQDAIAKANPVVKLDKIQRI